MFRFHLKNHIHSEIKMFENRVLRRIFGPKRDEVTGDWRNLHNEELYKLYSPNIIKMIKSRRMRWAGHVARMGGKEECIKDIGGENQKERNHCEDQDVGVWKMLK
jgi:hypothetical protein